MDNPHNVSESCILKDYNRTFAQELVGTALQHGPMPKHVAIIMDGNRRFAKENGLPTVSEGHRKGEDTLLQVISMYFDLGIEEMTVYTFSDENFKRTPTEVKAIMDLTLKRMRKIITEKGQEELGFRGIRWDMTGNWLKVPSLELKSAFAKTCIFTKGYKTLKMHLAFAYSAHFQMNEGINHLVNGLSSESISVGDINEQIYHDVMSMNPTHPVDILIRTGGDYRYSDFLMWHAGTAFLEFIDITWPEFSNWDLIRAIVSYQCQVLLDGLPLNTSAYNHHDIASGEIITKSETSGTEFIQSLRNDMWERVSKFVR